jgi:hypothetical protein
MKLCLTVGDLRAAKRAGKIGVIMEHFLLTLSGKLSICFGSSRLLCIKERASVACSTHPDVQAILRGQTSYPRKVPKRDQRSSPRFNVA